MEEEKLTVSPPGRRWNEHSKQDTRRYSHDDDCIYVNLKARHHEPTNEDSAYSAMDDIDMEDIDTHDDNANDIEAFSQLATMEMPGRTYFGGENNNGNGNGNDENTDSDDNADSDDNTDSDEETDGDEENDGDEGNDGEEYIGNLMRTIYSHFHEFSPGLLNWMKRAEYKVPEQDRLPALDGRPVQPDINKPKDFHFRCPLYWLDQARYVTCLAHPLRSIQDVMDHIELHHSEPPYCPICYEVFNNTGSRDSHVKERFCSKLDGEVHGYNKRQLTRMAKRDNIRLPEATRWKQILEIGVKHEQGTLADEMAYLTDGSGLKITKLRDYIFVFLDENSAGGNDIEAYVDVIWNQLNITGWLTEFIQHDQSHLDRVESDAMAISTSLEVWLKRNFVLRPETVSGNGNVGVGNKTSYEFDVEKSRPRYQYLLDMIGSDQKSAFVASLKNWILTTQIPYRIACPFYVHNPDANSDCLMRNELLSFKDLSAHIKRFHSTCTNCCISYQCQVYDDPNRHSPRCQLAQPLGSNRMDRRLLDIAENINSNTSDTAQWQGVWSAAFPGCPPPSTSQNTETKTLARTYWKYYGRALLAQWFEENEDWDRKIPDELLQLGFMRLLQLM